MGLFRGLLGLARRGSDLLTEEEIISLNKSMEGIPEFEPLIQNDIIPVDYDLAEEMVAEANRNHMMNLMRHETGGSAAEVQSLFDSVINPKPTRQREMQLMHRIDDLEKTEKALPWMVGGVGYGAYQLGRKNERERR